LVQQVPKVLLEKLVPLAQVVPQEPLDIKGKLVRQVRMENRVQLEKAEFRDLLVKLELEVPLVPQVPMAQPVKAVLQDLLVHMVLQAKLAPLEPRVQRVKQVRLVQLEVRD
jgi:hypothetical protein